MTLGRFKSLAGWLLINVLLSGRCYANVECAGTVYMIYKSNDWTTPSVSLKLTNGTITTWISLPSTTDVAMALTARAAGLPVRVYWTAADVTVCANGWAQNRPLQGWFLIDPS